MRTPHLGALSMLAPSRARYLAVLDWSFAVFSSLRMLTYLPTMWAIHQQGDSSQHSLLTWLVWMGANATMAASLYERSDHRMNKLILVNTANALQCLATAVLVAWYR
ncbi:hypothetical protein [Pseudorhodoferax sp.]|uniref:hypothetical protein n=1 Tax=Pseudorhodoferax sp. TaxID=1993553 RepID=UPI002DD64D7B|nr:hypothetical protein [Pseudorhodoferax sp.]